jgi:hypothetical protein
VQVNEGQGAGGLNKWVSKELTTDYSVETSPTTFVRFVTAPANNVRVRVLRDSDASTGLVDFANGSVLTETELDNSYEHNRYLAEEAEEGITGGSLVKNTDGQFDADALRIENLADPDSNDDAVNKGYADNRYVDVAGDTMTGPLTLNADPSLSKNAATKQYVDNKVNQLTYGGDAPLKWQFTGLAGANSTYAVTGAEVQGDTAYDVSIDGLVQEPGVDFTVNPDTDTLTIIPTLNSGEDIVVIQRGFGVAVTGTVGTNSLVDGAVTSDKISTTDTNFNVQSDGKVGIGTASPLSQLDISGTTKKLYAIIGDYTNNSFNSPEVVLRLNGDSLLAGGGPGLSFNGGVECAQLFGVRAGGGEGGDFFIKTRTYDPVTATSSLIEYFRIKENGRVGINTDSPTSTLHVNGSLSKSSGSFKIKHPLKPETHELVHSFVEAPQADNIYRGKVNLQNGTAKVNIDTSVGMTEGTFAALNREIQVFTSNESDWDAVKGNVEGNILTINCQNSASTATVSWLVIGERQDDHMYDTEWTDENGKVIVEPLAT